MSELITNERRGIRWQLLTTASALVLMGYTTSTCFAHAEDSDRPTVWIEVGGQLEAMQNSSEPFRAPFMSPVNPPDFYKGNGFFSNQRPVGSSLGFEGAITFQPKESDWLFSANIRYGRAQAKQHSHNQIDGPKNVLNTFGKYANFTTPHPFHDSTAQSAEHHLVVDFEMGKDVGIGSFGKDGHSIFSAGVRLVEFKEQSALTIYARPSVDIAHLAPGFAPTKYIVPAATFYRYSLTAQAERRFRAAGPALSWDASMTVLGNGESGKLTFDWGANASVLFGKQKTKIDHQTSAYHHVAISHPLSHNIYANLPVYDTGNHITRSRSVTVPNLGGFAGLSVRYPNAKISVGYRADFFFGALDDGIDTRQVKDMGFYGPFAKISIGLGG